MFAAPRIIDAAQSAACISLQAWPDVKLLCLRDLPNLLLLHVYKIH